MKKLLALVLALVMVMGLATVGTNAATEYSDKADFNYEEAIAVMSAIGVLEGADGKFRPTAELKRSEAAKIVAYLNTNNKTAEGLVGSGKFADVPTNHWAAGYVDYLTSIGVIAGKSATNFDPDGDLKAIDFAKMLLVVIGFDPKIEGLTGNDYKINVSKLANQAGLFDGLKDLKADDVLTREQAAQMAFNAVKAATVEYSNKGGEISLNGATVSLGASNFNYVTTTIAKDATNIDDRVLTNAGINSTNTGYTIEFGERQYPDLKRMKTTDDFGRPANEWTYGKQNVGKYINTEGLLGSFTTYVTGADLYNLIGDAKIKNTANEDFHYVVNGLEYDYYGAENFRTSAVALDNITRNNKIPYAFTGNGVLTEVYEKDDDLYVITILTYCATADGDYNAKTEKLNLKDISTSITNAEIAPDIITNNNNFNAYVEAEDVPAIANYKDGAALLVRYAWKGNGFVPVEVEDCKTETNQTISKFSVDTEKMAGNDYFYNGYVVTGGAQKAFSKTVKLADELQGYSEKEKALDSTYTLYYDNYGYVIRAKIENASTKYVFIAGLDTGTSNLGAKNADAFAIFQDGSSATIKVNVSKTNDNIDDFNSVITNGKLTDNTPQTWWGSKKDFTKANGYLDANTTQYERFDNAVFGAPVSPYAVNRWFTYSVSGEGANAIYTLSPCANALMVNQQTTVNNFKTVNGANLLKINTKTARIVGDAVDYAGTAPAKGLQAWGNDKSVYITVKNSTVSAAAVQQGVDAGYKRAISEVAGIYTGIQNVDITAGSPLAAGVSSSAKEKTANPFTQSAWVVFDKDKYVISAVVMGSDGGNTGNYIYAISEAKSEWKEGSYYYWDFNAIVDGEEKVLTVKSQLNDTADRIAQHMTFDQNAGEGALFDVTYDKDGYVTEATWVNWNVAANDEFVYGNKKLVNDAGGANAYAKAFDGEKVYNTYFHEDDTYTYAANTLYNRFNNTSLVNPALYGGDGTGVFDGDLGLTIASGAPIYVVQEQVVATTLQTSTLVEKFTSLDKALAAIADVNGNQSTSEKTRQLSGYVSAALNTNGTAKWVVIKNVGTKVDVNNFGRGGTDKQGITLSDYIVGGHFVVTLTGFQNVKTPVTVTWYDSTNVKTVSIPYAITPNNSTYNFSIGNNALDDVTIGALTSGDTITVTIDGTYYTTETRKVP